MKEVTPFYSSARRTGVPPATWGRIERAAVYTDIFDENDLTRRTKQAAAEGGRVGKRIALGLRTDALLPFDGYDIGDHLPVRIQRGVVDTTRYGAGYWTLMGVEWRVFPDGHSETTLVTLPKEDGSTPDPDLIPSLPVDEGGGLGGQEWEIGYVPRGRGHERRQVVPRPDDRHHLRTPARWHLPACRPPAGHHATGWPCSHHQHGPQRGGAAHRQVDGDHHARPGLGHRVPHDVGRDDQRQRRGQPAEPGLDELDPAPDTVPRDAPPRWRA